MAMQKFQEIAEAIASGTALIGGSGNMVILSNPTITVKDAGTNNISTIFSDEGVTALANPFTGDSSGRFAFYASDGDYDVTVSKSGFNSYTIPDVQLFVTQTSILDNFTAVIAPTVNDDVSLNYVVGSSWVDTVANNSYICVDNTAGNAVWEKTNGNILNVLSDGSVPFTAIQEGITPASTDIATILATKGYVDNSAGRVGKNLLINALGTINQRGYVSGTATTIANQYTLDRWRVVTSGQNLTFSNTANVVTMTAPAGGVEQVIEGLNIQSGTHVISWTGTATCTVDTVAKTSGDTFTLTGGTNATIKFSNGTYSKPQVEEGSVVTSFDNRKTASELLLCQRYTVLVPDTQYFAGKGDSTTQATWMITVPVPLRGTPTIEQTWTVVRAYDQDSVSTVSGSPTITISAFTDYALKMILAGFAGLTTNACLVINAGGTTNMILSSEI